MEDKKADEASTGVAKPTTPQEAVHSPETEEKDPVSITEDNVKVISTGLEDPMSTPAEPKQGERVEEDPQKLLQQAAVSAPEAVADGSLTMEDVERENERLREENALLTAKVEQLQKVDEGLRKSIAHMTASLERSQEEKATLEETWKRKVEESNAFWEFMMEQTGNTGFGMPSIESLKLRSENLEQLPNATSYKDSVWPSEEVTSMTPSGKGVPDARSFKGDGTVGFISSIWSDVETVFASKPREMSVSSFPTSASSTWQDLMDEEKLTIAGLEWQVEDLKRRNARLEERLDTNHVENLIQVNYLLAEKLALEEKLAGGSSFGEQS